MEEEHWKNKKHVQWDEEKLKETEKYRGTFQKIDQPKTPYRKNEESDEEMEPEAKSQDEIALEQSLYKAKINSNANNHKKVNIEQLNMKLKEELSQFHSGQKSQMEDEEQQQQRRKKKQQFKKKRMQHYNEFQLIQKMKQQRWQDEQD